MRRAYQLAAEVVDTEQFLLADGDFAVNTDFTIATLSALAEDAAMQVWRASKPLYSPVYSYGGAQHNPPPAPPPPAAGPFPPPPPPPPAARTPPGDPATP